MANLTKNNEMKRKAANYGRRYSLPAKASTKYYRGGAVAILKGTDDLLVKPAGVANERFRGIVEDPVDNTSGTDRADENGLAAYVDVLADCLISPTFAVAPTAADLMKMYYWSDDNNVTLTPGTKGRAGRLVQIDRDGYGWLDILPVAMGDLPPKSLIIPYNASSVDAYVFIADKAYRNVTISLLPSVAGTDAGAVTVDVRKITDTTLPGAAASGTCIELLQAALNLKGAAGTKQTGTLVATDASQCLAVGDKLGLNFIGVLTAAVGLLQIDLEEL